MNTVSNAARSRRCTSPLLTEQQESARAALSWAVAAHVRTAEHALDEPVVEQIARHAPAAAHRIAQWLAAAAQAGRDEAEEEAERAAERRERAALMTCTKCGQYGRYAREKDIPTEEYDVRTASEWLERHDGLTICDACGHQWWVLA